MPSRTRLDLTSTALFALSVLALGCARMVTVDYEPSNSLKGQGVLSVVPFRYEAADEHRVRPREVESIQGAQRELFLTQEVGAFFTEALRRELAHAGYTVNESGALTVSGSITRFYADWKRDVDRLFELNATYNVRSGEQIVFTWACSTVQKGPNTLAQDTILIRKGTADCMHRFIQASQEANGLQK